MACCVLVCILVLWLFVITNDQVTKSCVDWLLVAVCDLLG